MFKINSYKFELITLSIIILVLFNISWTAQAIVISNENSSKVINNISVSATTGNNEATSGEVVEGQAESSVKVKTIINDQVVEDIDITETTEGGTASVKVESRVEADSDKATVETTTVINDEETTEKQVIDLAGEKGVPTLFSENVEATSVSSVEPDENQSVQAENIIAKVFINIFNAIKAGILKIFSIFT